MSAQTLTADELAEIEELHGKVMDFILSQVSDSDTVSASELALGAMAAHSVSVSLERAALDVDGADQ